MISGLGSGTSGLSLPAANAITGNTSVNGVSLTLGSAQSIGNGNLTITGTSILTPTQALTFSSSQSLTLNNANVTFGAGAPITFNGTATLIGIVQVTESNTSGTYFNGQITGSGQLSLLGAATTFLTNANYATSPNNYTGGTMLGGTAGSTVVVNDNSALSNSTAATNVLGINGVVILVSGGTGNLTISQPVYVTTASTLTLTAVSDSSSGITFTNSVFGLANTLTIVNNVVGQTITSGVVSATVTIQGSVTDIGAARTVTYEGPGSLLLSGTNTYAGGTTLASQTAGNVGNSYGTLSVGSGSALGTGTITLTTGVLNNANSGTSTFNNLVAVSNGAVVAFTGAALIFSNPLATAITLTTAATFLVGNNTTFDAILAIATSPTALTLSGVPIVSGDATITPTGSLTIQQNAAVSTNTNVSVTVSGGSLVFNSAVRCESVAPEPSR